MPLVTTSTFPRTGRWPVWAILAVLAAWSLGAFLWFHAIRSDSVLGVEPGGLFPASFALIATASVLTVWLGRRWRRRA